MAKSGCPAGTSHASTAGQRRRGGIATRIGGRYERAMPTSRQQRGHADETFGMLVLLRETSMARGKFDGAAGLLHSQHSDKSFGHLIALNDVLNELLLAKPTLPIFVGPPGFSGQSFRVNDEFL